MVVKIVRTVNDVRNPKYINAEQNLIDCEVDFDELDENYVPFTANPNDIEIHGKQIYADCVAGKYGTVAAFDSVAFEANKKAHEDAIKEADDKYKASLDKWKALGLSEEDLENLKIK